MELWKESAAVCGFVSVQVLREGKEGHARWSLCALFPGMNLEISWNLGNNYRNYMELLPPKKATRQGMGIIQASAFSSFGGWSAPGGSIGAGILQAIQYEIAFHCNSCDGYDWRVVQWSLGEPEMENSLKFFFLNFSATFCDYFSRRKKGVFCWNSSNGKKRGRRRNDGQLTHSKDDGTHFCTGSSSRGLWHPNGFDSAFCQLFHRGASWKCSWWGFSNWRLWVVHQSGGKDPDPCDSRGLDHSHEGAWT